MKGHVQQRGARTWRLKFDIGRDPEVADELPAL